MESIQQSFLAAVGEKHMSLHLTEDLSLTARLK